MNRPLVLALLFASGCGIETTDVTADDDTLQTDESQLAADKADRACQVVLRSVARPAATGGFATKCTANGPCYYVWEGFIDVASTSTVGAKAYVLYRSIDQTV